MWARVGGEQSLPCLPGGRSARVSPADTCWSEAPDRGILVWRLSAPLWPLFTLRSAGQRRAGPGPAVQGELPLPTPHQLWPRTTRDQSDTLKANSPARVSAGAAGKKRKTNMSTGRDGAAAPRAACVPRNQDMPTAGWLLTGLQCPCLQPLPSGPPKPLFSTPSPYSLAPVQSPKLRLWIDSA